MRKLLLLILYFALTPCVIIASLVVLAWYSYTKQDGDVFIKNNSTIAYTALPISTQQVSGSVTETDARINKLKNFLHRHRSVLEQYTDDIITASDMYGLDYRLLTAIATQESNVCQRIIKNSYNCWGWGITAKKTTRFDNYPQAIETISRLFAKNYINKGLITPEEIGKVYNPGDTNSWADKVNYFMNEIGNEPIIAYLTNL
jgi:hypothetical protein